MGILHRNHFGRVSRMAVVLGFQIPAAREERSFPSMEEPMNHRWTKADDECLALLCTEVEKAKLKDWNYIGQKMDLPPSACMERWNQLIRQNYKGEVLSMGGKK